MNKVETELTKKIGNVIKDIRDYISNTPNWIFYFLNPFTISEANKPIETCVKENPDSWEDYITFGIDNIQNGSAQVSIHIDDGTEEGIHLKRHISLLLFQDAVSNHKKLWDGKLNEIRIETLTSEITRLKERLNEKENELNELITIMSTK